MNVTWSIVKFVDCIFVNKCVLFQRLSHLLKIDLFSHMHDSNCIKDRRWYQCHQFRTWIIWNVNFCVIIGEIKDSKWFNTRDVMLCCTSAEISTTYMLSLVHAQNMQETDKFITVTSHKHHGISNHQHLLRITFLFNENIKVLHYWSLWEEFVLFCRWLHLHYTD